MSAEQVGAENPSAAFLDQHVVAGVFLANPSGGIPAGGNSPLGLEAKALFPSGLFLQADRSQWRDSKNDTRDGEVVGLVTVAFEQVRRDDPALVARHGGQRRATTGGGIACRIDCLVRDALEVLVDLHASLVPFDAGGLEVQVLNFGHASCPVYDQVRFKDALCPADGSADRQPAAVFLDLLRLGIELAVNAQSSRPLDQLIDKVRIEEV